MTLTILQQPDWVKEIRWSGWLPWPGSQSERFERLADNWQKDTAGYPTIRQKVKHACYRQIIAMGEDVVPLILNRLCKERNHWFWALSELTGEQPVPKDACGDVDKMTEAWLDWGRRKGLME